jgi:hypothetical protein
MSDPGKQLLQTYLKGAVNSDKIGLTVQHHWKPLFWLGHQPLDVFKVKILFWNFIRSLKIYAP